MLKTRVVGVLIVRNGIVVQSVGFRSYFPVGKPEIAVEYLSRWGIDEIVVLDIDATAQKRKPSFEKIGDYSRYCQVPLSVGGGIRTVEDLAKVVHSGADKVVLNTIAVESPDFITQGAKLFGSQCIVVSIDAKRNPDGQYTTYTHSGSKAVGLSPVDLAKRVVGCGAGEIILNSIDRDGSKAGYDLELASAVTSAVDIPVVICGGVGHAGHLVDGITHKVSGIAAANFFHFTEHSVVLAKRYLARQGKDIRLDSYVDYVDISFDEENRVAKLNDDFLNKLRFVYVPEEII